MLTYHLLDDQYRYNKCWLTTYSMISTVITNVDLQLTPWSVPLYQMLTYHLIHDQYRYNKCWLTI